MGNASCRTSCCAKDDRNRTEIEVQNEYPSVTLPFEEECVKSANEQPAGPDLRSAASADAPSRAATEGEKKDSYQIDAETTRDPATDDTEQLENNAAAEPKKESSHAEEAKKDSSQHLSLEQRRELLNRDTPDFNMLLRTGRLKEAEILAGEANVRGLYLEHPKLEWLAYEMDNIKDAVARLMDTNGNTGAKNWKSEVLPEIGTVRWRWNQGVIEFCAIMELPARIQDGVAINVDIDLNSEWAPFVTKVSPMFSTFSSSLITFSALKIPGLPGSREIYTHRTIVDCFGAASVIDGREGVLFVDVSPDVWKTGGRYKEFDIPKPPGGWVSRDEQRLSVAFWEPLDESRAQLTLFGEVVFSVSKYLIPDRFITWLIRMVTQTTHKNLKKVFSDFEAYNKRVRESSNPLYSSVISRQEEYHKRKKSNAN
jgi:hypothetical protein